MTELEGKQVLAVLFAAYAVETRNVSPEEVAAMVHVYRKGLADLDSAIVAQAIDQLTKSAERMPTIAKIRQTVVELQHGRRRPGGDAWGEVRKAISNSGAYEPRPLFSDALVTRAVDQMGWENLCMSTNHEASRARFIELYDEYAYAVRAQAQIADGATHPALPAAPAARLEGPAPLRQLVATVAGKVGWEGP